MKPAYSILIAFLLSVIPCFGQWQCEYKQADPMYDQEAAYFFSYIDTRFGAAIGFYDSNCSVSKVGIRCPERVDYYIDYIRTPAVRCVTVRVGFYENKSLLEKFDITCFVGDDRRMLIFTESDSVVIKYWLLCRGSVRFIIPQRLETNLDFTVPRYNGGKPIYEQ